MLRLKTGMSGPGHDLPVALAALGVSLLVHASLTLAGAMAPERTYLCLESQWAERALGLLVGEREVPVEPSEPPAPARAHALGVNARTDARWEPPRWYGGALVARPDTGRAGRGGEEHVSQAALNLADANDGIRLAEALETRVDRSQLYRRRTEEQRASSENAALGTEPASLLLLGEEGLDAETYWSAARRDTPRTPELRAAGAAARGGEAERVATSNAVSGATMVTGSGLEASTTMGARPSVGERSAQPFQVLRAGLGMPDWPSEREAADANAALGQAAFERLRLGQGAPQVEQGRASAPSETRGLDADTVDAAQEESSLKQGALAASSAGGAPGPGTGGERGQGESGAGGPAGPGSRSSALGDGPGVARGAPPDDPRKRAYIRGVLAKVHPLWRDAFPRQAALLGLQGTSIIGFVILPNGSVVGVNVTRPSGIPQFDDNCKRAVLRAAPFAPLPPELRPALSFQLPFAFENPAVRPPSFASAR